MESDILEVLRHFGYHITWWNDGWAVTDDGDECLASGLSDEKLANWCSDQLDEAADSFRELTDLIKPA